MFDFFMRGMFERLARRRVPRSQGLALIQGLRTHFATVIYPHQTGRVAFFFGGHCGFIDMRIRVRPFADRWRGQGTQNGIEFGNNTIQRGQFEARQHGDGSSAKAQ